MGVGTVRSGGTSTSAIGRIAVVLALIATLVAAPTVVASGAEEGAGFTDIAKSPHAGYIEAIAAAGITSGFQDGTFRPGGSVTRAQMATFLAKALELPGGEQWFFDVSPTHPHRAGIGAVAAAGITTGCAGGGFCPSDFVTRGQMATFLSKALDLPVGFLNFVDVPLDHRHAAGIAAVAQAGITTGCAGGGFCPNDFVTRGQMARFLGVALGLEPIIIDYPEPEPPPVPEGGAVAVVSDFIVGHELAHAYSLKPDTWKIWICKVPPAHPHAHGNERVNLDVNAATKILRDSMIPYFTWLSGGRYDLRIEAGGVFTLPMDSSWIYNACMVEATKRSSGATGAMAIVDLPQAQGIGGIGMICAPNPCATTLPHSQRGAAVGAASVVPAGWWPEAALSVVAHEIGHALGWPHSYPVGSHDDYSDPIDIMSGAHELVGTIAANRFSSGWLGDKARTHPGGTREYTIGSVGFSGTQMVAVKSQSPLAHTSIGAITKTGRNALFNVEGVTVHRVDQRPDNCMTWGWLTNCAHTERRHAPMGPANEFRHVLGVGESMNLGGGTTLTVLSRQGDGFRIRISGDTAPYAPVGR